MMLRTIARCAALILGLLVCLNPPAANACDGASCRKAAVAKPLDLKKFMQQQAASTRAYARRVQAKRAHARTAVRQERRTERHTAAILPRPAPLPDSAAAAFAAEPAPPVQAVADGEITAIDAAKAPAETTGAAPGAGPIVQLVAAEEFNEIDRKAGDRAASVSWMQWIWSALGGALDALSTAIKQLVG